MSTLEVNKITPVSGGTAVTMGDSGDTFTVPTGAGLTVTDEVKTNKISPASGTAFTLGDSGDTFTVPSGVTFANSGTATGFGGTNTPYAVARPNGNQTISSSTWTTVSLGTEILDSDNAFSSNTFTVPSGKAGKYLISYSVRDLATTKAVTIQTTIAIDGTRDNVPLQDWNFDPDYEAKIFTTSNTIIKDLSVGEAVTLQHYALTNGGSPQIREFGTYLSIMRIIT